MNPIERIIGSILLIFATSAPLALKASETDVANLPRLDSLEAKVRQLIDTVRTTLDGKAHIDSAEFEKMGWEQQLYETGFEINNPKIKYPPFVRFAIKVYDWGDRTFNSYNPEYVIGTGKNWKAVVNTYSWMETYMMLFSKNMSGLLHIRSDLYNDIGLHLSFMAVSIGYTAKIKNWGPGQSKRKNLNFNFTCSRLSANIDFTSTKGGTHITHFGDYNSGKSLNYPFNDILHRSFSGEAYYFFNNLKYSQAAAYCFSKYQLKSAGSWIAGFSFNSQKINMDFSSLPEDMKQFLPSLDNQYRFIYTDYSIVGGYSHNFVLRPKKWLINLTALPSLGFRHSYRRSSEGRRSMVALNGHARFSLVYNHRALFASLAGRFDANLFFNGSYNYAFFNSTESLSAIIGCRF